MSVITLNYEGQWSHFDRIGLDQGVQLVRADVIPERFVDGKQVGRHLVVDLSR